MTRVAHQPSGVLSRNHLRKRFRLRGAGGVTLRAENRRIRLHRHQRSRIVGVFGQRAVARLAVHSGVFALSLGLSDFTVAQLASLMAGVSDGERGNFGDRIAAIMPVLAEAARQRKGANRQEEQCSYDEYAREAEQMFGVLHTRALRCNFEPVRFALHYHRESRTGAPNCGK